MTKLLIAGILLVLVGCTEERRTTYISGPVENCDYPRIIDSLERELCTYKLYAAELRNVNRCYADWFAQRHRKPPCVGKPINLIPCEEQ